MIVKEGGPCRMGAVEVLMEKDFWLPVLSFSLPSHNICAFFEEMLLGTTRIGGAPTKHKYLSAQGGRS